MFFLRISIIFRMRKTEIIFNVFRILPCPLNWLKSPKNNDLFSEKFKTYFPKFRKRENLGLKLRQLYIYIYIYYHSSTTTFNSFNSWFEPNHWIGSINWDVAPLVRRAHDDAFARQVQIHWSWRMENVNGAMSQWTIRCKSAIQSIRLDDHIEHES